MLELQYEMHMSYGYLMSCKIRHSKFTFTWYSDMAFFFAVITHVQHHKTNSITKYFMPCTDHKYTLLLQNLQCKLQITHTYKAHALKKNYFIFFVYLTVSSNILEARFFFSCVDLHWNEQKTFPRACMHACACACVRACMCTHAWT